ncbi:MAG: hypothetical protein D6797_01260 [Bdellovibrio sp.]|nr:MAG: hypothetical protein D6797_01260 [Bdellovibrio sp.]
MTNQRGQAATEYLLLLVVIILMAGLVKDILGSSFKKYFDGYFTTYLDCLIQMGELPSLQGGGGQCSQYLPSALAGTDGVGSGSGNRGPNELGEQGNRSGGGRGTQKSKKGQKNEDGSSQGGFQSSTASSSGASGGGGGGAPVEFNRRRRHRRSSHLSRRVLKTNPSTQGQLNEAQSLPAGRVIYEDDLGEYIGAQGFTGYLFLSSPDSLDEELMTAPKPLPLKEEQVKKLKKEKFQMQKVRRRVASQNMEIDMNTGWSFGKLFRYLIIAAILIALFVLIGGQALRLSKELE